MKIRTRLDEEETGTRNGQNLARIRRTVESLVLSELGLFTCRHFMTQKWY